MQLSFSGGKWRRCGHQCHIWFRENRSARLEAKFGTWTYTHVTVETSAEAINKSVPASIHSMGTKLFHHHYMLWVKTTAVASLLICLAGDKGVLTLAVSGGKSYQTSDIIPYACSMLWSHEINIFTVSRGAVGIYWPLIPIKFTDVVTHTPFTVASVGLSPSSNFCFVVNDLQQQMT
jgi:hypothetical protein